MSSCHSCPRPSKLHHPSRKAPYQSAQVPIVAFGFFCGVWSKTRWASGLQLLVILLSSSQFLLTSLELRTSQRCKVHWGFPDAVPNWGYRPLVASCEVFSTCHQVKMQQAASKWNLCNKIKRTQRHEIHDDMHLTWLSSHHTKHATLQLPRPYAALPMLVGREMPKCRWMNCKSKSIKSLLIPKFRI